MTAMKGMTTAPHYGLRNDHLAGPGDTEELEIDELEDDEDWVDEDDDWDEEDDEEEWDEIEDEEEPAE
jgi:hypothetical protein